MNHISDYSSKASLPSDPTGDSSTEERLLLYRPGKKLSKREKVELKRMRNRMAAKKSRKLKKEHFEDLEQENQCLKDENLRLQRELELLRQTCQLYAPHDPAEHPPAQMELEPLVKEEDDGRARRDPPSKAEEIVNELKEALDRQKKTDDDMRYERLTESWSAVYLPKMFLVVLVLCACWLANPAEKGPTFFGVECEVLPRNSSDHSVCIDMQRRDCLRGICPKEQETNRT